MESEVTAVAIKLPTFWPLQAEVWFLQAEAQFAIKGITADDTKYNYLVAALDQETASRVLAQLTSPPKDVKYATLKQALLDTYTLSEDDRATRLVNMPHLSDSLPSLLMDQMLALLGDHKPCFLFKHLFLQKLPADIRIHLARLDTNDYRQLAKEADKLFLANSSGRAIHSVQRSQDACMQPGHGTQDHEVCATTAWQRRPRQGKRDKQTNASSPPPPTPLDTGDLCYYHYKFGAQAKKCQLPCAFPGNATGRR